MVAHETNSEDAMKLSRIASLPVTLACSFHGRLRCASQLLCSGARHPPPYNSVPPLIARADHEGFRAGSEDGARDAYNGFGHHPERDRKYHEAPGYDPALGPFGPYRDAFRSAYVRGYDQAFYRR